MKTSLNIPNDMLNELLRRTKSKTKKDAILTAISEYNRRARQSDLTKYLGTLPSLISAKELQEMRNSRVKNGR